jgi:hypothetical protein
MHQQLWGYKVEWKSVSRGTGGGGKVEYHWSNPQQQGIIYQEDDSTADWRITRLLLDTSVRVGEGRRRREETQVFPLDTTE